MTARRIAPENTAGDNNELLCPSAGNAHTPSMPMTKCL